MAGKIRGEQIKDNTITEDDIHDDAIKHFVYGQADLNSNNKPVNWVNASSITTAHGIKSWMIIPFDCTIDRIIATVQGNNFNTTNDGQFTLQVYKNQPNFDSTAASASTACDNFAQKVSNMGGGTIDCNQKTFTSAEVGTSFSEGDLMQIKVNKTSGDERDISVTVVFT